MSRKKEKPVHVRQHTGRQIEQNNILLFPSNNNNTTTLDRCQLNVSDFLLCGAENAITGEVLVHTIGLSDLRQLTAIIERERKEGVPICANCCDPRGYYLAGTEAELEAYIKSLDRRLKNIRLTRTACDETLRRMNGQAQLDGWNDG